MKHFGFSGILYVSSFSSLGQGGRLGVLLGQSSCLGYVDNSGTGLQ